MTYHPPGVQVQNIMLLHCAMQGHRGPGVVADCAQKVKVIFKWRTYISEELNRAKTIEQKWGPEASDRLCAQIALDLQHYRWLISQFYKLFPIFDPSKAI